MKTFVMLLAISVMLPLWSFACDKGCEEHEGVCACSAPMEKADASQEVKPSDEKPPRSGRPSYEAPGIQAALAPLKGEAPPSDDAAGKLPNGGVPQR